MLTFFILFTSFFLKKKHVLSLLLILELILVLLFITFLELEGYFSLFILCVGVLGGVIGLSSMIRSTRVYSLSLYVQS